MDEIKQGYKQTDIGVISENWEAKSIDEIFKFLSTATFSRTELGVEGEIQCLHYGDIHTKFHEFIDFNLVTLPKLTGKRSLKYTLLQNGDLIMADASEDYVGLCKSVEIKNIANKKAISGLHTIFLREKSITYENGFKGYLFLVPEVRKQLIGLATGMKVYGVSKNNLTQVLLPVPTQSEQTAIATALSDVDALIAALDKKITKKQQIKQGTMQQLLTGKKRLPRFSGEWVEKKLGDCFNKVVGGGTPSRSVPEYWNGNIPWATVKDFASFNPKFTQENITSLGLHNSASHLIPKETPITSTRMGLGKIMIYSVDVAINQDMKALFISEDYEKNYIIQWFVFSQEKIELMGTGSTVKGIRLEQLNDIEIHLPRTKYEQTEIAQVLTDMDNEISQLEADRNKYKQIKAGMMQQLLTGKIRLVKSTTEEQFVEKQIKGSYKIAHNQYFEDAVLVAAIVNSFYSDKYILGRKKVQKLLYLLRRKQDAPVSVFKRKAAGPYADEIRYKGGEPIARNKKYIVVKSNNKGSIFSKGESIHEAIDYIEKWNMQHDIDWLVSQFRYTTVNQLEVLATIDMARCDLEKENISISLHSIKNLIRSDKEWKDKLNKPYFNDLSIQNAINESLELFS